MSLENALRTEYARRFPLAAARCLETAAPEKLVAEAADLDPDALAALLERLTPLRAAALFEGLTLPMRVEVTVRAPPGLMLGLLGPLAACERNALLAALPGAARGDLERLLDLPAESVSRLMDHAAPAAPDHFTVQEALERLRTTRTRQFTTVWVLSGRNRLAGAVSLRDLALADPGDRLRALSMPVTVFARATANREDVAALLERHQSDALPVVDHEGRLLGVVRHESLLSVVEDAATADMQRMVGASSEERALSTPWFSVTHRLPWLHINLLTAFLAAGVVALFEGLIAQFTALAVLLPVVAGQSGNAGAQALAVTMRGLSLREIGTREWRRVLRKEVLTGAVNGTALAVTCGAGVFFWSRSPGLSLVIAIAMVLSMVAAGIAGALVPIFLTRMGRDPATASSILQTTVTDVAGFLSFLGVASSLSFLL